MRLATTTFILKTVSTCNLACNYCYACYDQNKKLSIIDEEVIRKIVEGISELPTNRVQFIWHGGEPLLAGKSFFFKVKEIEDKYKRQNQFIENSIQTNGTLLSDSWIEDLTGLDFGIGVSIDGPKFLHDQNRVFQNKKGSHSQTLRGIKALQERNIKVSTCAVITKNSIGYANEIYEFFKDNSIYEYDILPCLPHHGNTLSNSLAVEPESFAFFLIELFDIWFQDDDPRVQIRFLVNIIESLLLGYSTLCKLTGNCSSFISIDTDGKVYPCDSFIGLEDYYLGNLHDENLPSILQGERYKTFVSQSSSPITMCQKCKWLPYCHGGCSYQRYISGNDILSCNYFCRCNQLIFDHISKRLENFVIVPK